MPNDQALGGSVETNRQDRFGDRFDGYKLAVVQDIFWPVFAHAFTFSYREPAPLNALEEGLLRLVAAGVNDDEDARQFLGIGRPYFEGIVGSLCETSLRPWPHPLRCFPGGRLEAGQQLSDALARAEKIVLREVEANFLRDGLFDSPIDYCENRFHTIRSATEDSGGSWLGPLAPATLRDANSLGAEVLRTSPACAREVIHYTLAQDGQLAWIRLALACYESDSGRTGRFLLFNPEDDDRPLDDLSLLFEGLLETRIPPLYYPPDPLSTAAQFWSGIAAQIQTVRLEEELAEHKVSLEPRPMPPPESSEEDWAENMATALSQYAVHLAAGRIKKAGRDYRSAGTLFLEKLPGQAVLRQDPATADETVTSDIHDATTVVQRVAVDAERSEDTPRVRRDAAIDLARDIGNCPTDKDELISAELRLRKLIDQEGYGLVLEDTQRRIDAVLQRETKLARIDKLESDLRLAPKIHHLRTEDHREWLQKALTKASHDIVIVSPWIKKRVLQPLLPLLSSAVRRGCVIWIGHGMPPNAFHQDRSDEEALKALDSLGQALIRTDKLGTHEKILICDDEFFIATSYNWLSFDGTNRRERGIVQSGGDVSKLRLEYVSTIGRLAGREPPKKAPGIEHRDGLESWKRSVQSLKKTDPETTENEEMPRLQVTKPALRPLNPSLLPLASPPRPSWKTERHADVVQQRADSAVGKGEEKASPHEDISRSLAPETTPGTSTVNRTSTEQ
jgi:hypothetical protein